jgi:hypothetical protein
MISPARTATDHDPATDEAGTYRAIAVRCWRASREAGCTGAGREYRRSFDPLNSPEYGEEDRMTTVPATPAAPAAEEERHRLTVLEEADRGRAVFPRPAHLGEIVAAALEALGWPPKPVLADIPSGLPEVMADRKRMFQPFCRLGALSDIAASGSASR